MIKKYINYMDIEYVGSSGYEEVFGGRLPFNNYDFPNNIFPPKDIEIDDEEYKLYLARFNNLYELYDYLRSDPRINTKVFKELSSIKKDSNFSGKPYEEAVLDLVRFTDEDYEQFIKIQEYISAREDITCTYKKYLTPTHGKLITPLYSAGKLNCYETTRRVKKSKFINVYISLAYSSLTKKEQVLHRAIIIANILKALENANYNINLNTFELSYLKNEIVYIPVQLKAYGEKLDLQSLYKVLMNVEFKRRILFRIIETLDVTNKWGCGYGYVCKKNFICKFLNLDNEDIYFEPPIDMGILGEDLTTDFENAIKHLGLEEVIDIEKSKIKRKTY